MSTGVIITETVYCFDFLKHKLEIAVLHREKDKLIRLMLDDKTVLETPSEDMELSDPELIKKTGEDFAREHANNKYSDLFMKHGDKLVMTEKIIRFEGATEYNKMRSEVIVSKGFTEITSETGIEGEQIHIRLAGDNFSDVFEKIRMTSTVMQKMVEEATKNITELSSDVVRDDFGW
ncbi:hypothetical protein SAMN02910275_01430 [Butyrivibrio sp. INlla18]|uniref:hypothetical protein n=1 Tax=Butyrivibrio sp. INlla18 TaxID=1520806 RepID=UPI00088AADF8|nr:hypothetical protein [Butyrivibrio sp. INlla18]SDA58734.1 hypothetical protein SAMN02910275_01430 [Butyrivibrio sp. INlla18]